jgi:hypothetical protein
MMSFGGESDIGWPEVDDLKRRLNVLDISVHDTEMAVILAAAIEWTKSKVGDWDELTDAPNEALAEAALQKAVESGSADEVGTTRDRFGNVHMPKSEQLLYGQRRRFGIG